MLRSVNTRLIRASLSSKNIGSCGMRRPHSAFLALLIVDRFTWLVACLNGFDQQRAAELLPGRFSRDFNKFSLNGAAQPGYVLSLRRCCSSLMGARKWCYCCYQPAGNVFPISPPLVNEISAHGFVQETRGTPLPTKTCKALLCQTDPNGRAISRTCTASHH